MRGASIKERDCILAEVALEFGYEDTYSYNHACKNSPREVLERIYGLLP